MNTYKNTNLPLEDRIKNLLSLMTIDEKISLLPTRQAAIPRLNVNDYSVGGEAAHGVVSSLGSSTIFPQPLGLASTFNKKILKDIGSVIGDEARIYYNKANRRYGLTLWAPTIDMERDPRWGRTEEAYGEDPILTGKLSSNLIQGMQGDDSFYLKFVPAPKHFYGNNNEEGRIYCSSSIDKRNKHEYYLKAFKPAFVDGKANSMMTAYNSINGTPCIVNKEVEIIVKGEWGCDGFVVCDGGDFSQTVDYHKYYKSHAETISGALKAGIDCFTDDADLVISAAKEALEKNLLTEADIDKALTNIFKIRFRLGEFDNDELNPYANIPEERLCCKEHTELALKACKESIVLLKNQNNILPLKEDKINNIAVLGPLADVIYKDWYCGNPPHKTTFLDGIKNKLSSVKVSFHNGNDTIKISHVGNDLFENNFEFCDWGFNSITLKNLSNNKYLTLEEDDKTINSSANDIWGWFVKEVFKYNNKNDNNFTLRTWDNEKISLLDNTLNRDINLNEDILFNKKIIDNGIESSKKLASESDIAIVVVGNHPLINAKEEIDRNDLILPPHQEELIKGVYSENPNTIVVIISSYPFAINWCNDNIPGIIHCTHGSQDLGTALTSCIFGDYNPAGRLPMTWYKSVNDLPSIMNYDIINSNSTYMYFNGTPLYEFGYGLSYTEFKYSNLILSSNTISNDGNIKINVSIENIGNISGDEVVQLYVSLESTRAKRPFKQLINFERINLNPSESKDIEFTINNDDLKYFDVSSDDFILESGSCKILIGSSSNNIKLTDNLTILGETLNPRNLNILTRAENYDSCFNIILEEAEDSSTCVSSIDSDNSWIKFSDVNFNNSKTLTLNTLIKGISTIEITLDSLSGPILNIINFNDNDLNNKWTSINCELPFVNFTHDLYIIFNGNISLNTLLLS